MRSLGSSLLAAIALATVAAMTSQCGGATTSGASTSRADAGGGSDATLGASDATLGDQDGLAGDDATGSQDDGAGGQDTSMAGQDGAGGQDGTSSPDGAGGDGAGLDGPSGACVPGQAQCSGNAMQVCATPGVWPAPVPCVNQACVAGACTGVCAPGAARCAGAVPQLCDASGAWASGASCAHGCTAGVCDPNDGGGGVCPSQCTTNAECQSACPAVPSGVNCCDLASATCYATTQGVCPVIGDAGPE